MKSNQDPRTITFEADPTIQKPDSKTNADNSLSEMPMTDKVQEASNVSKEESKRDQKTEKVRSKKRAIEDEEEVKGDQPKKQQLSQLEQLRLALKDVPQCTICTEELIDKKAEIEPCRHVFCMGCITKWAEIENTCPNCKQEFHKIVEKQVMLKAPNTTSNSVYKKQRTNRIKKSKTLNESKTSTDQ